MKLHQLFLTKRDKIFSGNLPINHGNDRIQASELNLGDLAFIFTGFDTNYPYNLFQSIDTAASSAL